MTREKLQELIGKMTLRKRPLCVQERTSGIRRVWKGWEIPAMMVSDGPTDSGNRIRKRIIWGG